MRPSIRLGVLVVGLFPLWLGCQSRPFSEPAQRAETNGETTPAGDKEQLQPKRVCELDTITARHFIDEPNPRNTERWQSDFAAVDKDLSQEQKAILTEEERYALFLWGESAYSAVRLLQAFPDEMDTIKASYAVFKNDATAAWYQKVTSDFERALAKLKKADDSPRRGTLYRGARTLDEQLLQCWISHSSKEDGSFVELGALGRRGAASSTKQLDDAEKFSGSSGFMMVLLDVNSAVDISPYKKNPGETEYTLLPGARFKIVSVGPDPRKPQRTIVTLKEWPANNNEPAE